MPPLTIAKKNYVEYEYEYEYEYEFAKGENIYEVQINRDAGTGMAMKIDITSDLWEAEATNRATDRAKDMKM